MQGLLLVTAKQDAVPFLSHTIATQERLQLGAEALQAGLTLLLEGPGRLRVQWPAACYSALTSS